MSSFVLTECRYLLSVSTLCQVMGIHSKQKPKRACSQKQAAFYLGHVRLSDKVMTEQRREGGSHVGT